MQAQAIDSLAAWPAALVAPGGVLILSGYGLDVRVWRGRLRIADGIGRQRRTAIVHRATGGLKRLVVLGHTGAITFDAIRWLADIGAGYLQIDADGQVLAAFGPQGTDRPGLRRAQARALDTPAGNDIARRLIAEKVAGQAETLVAVDRSVPVSDEVEVAMRSAAARVHLATNRDEIRLAEAQAAGAYWSAWAPIAVRFARRDVDRVPAHWLTVGSRASALTGGPRLATTPAQALLNLTYALLETEATLASRIVGLDPGLGVLHADQLNRDSLAADLMEPIRPLVDRYVLRLLEGRAFAASDFYETRQGVCRVTPPLACELAGTLREWRQAVGRVAEDVARRLDDQRPVGRALPTPISGSNRSVGRGSRAKGKPTHIVSRVARGCVWCGGPAAVGRRTCSAECRAAVDTTNLPTFIATGERSLAERRALGLRTVLTGAGRARIGGRASETVAEARGWQRTHPWPKDSGEFEREILPALAGVPAHSIAEATGLSVGYCRQIKKGAATPHPMWWEAMQAAGVARLRELRATGVEPVAAAARQRMASRQR
jgi:CRISPR-associated endonuclease Cas1